MSAIAPAPGSLGLTAQATVLVVDDDPAVRAVMRAVLSAAGFDVIEAASGTEALVHLGRVIPDAIVSDVMMPDLDGFGLVQAVRGDPALRTVPLLFVTTRSAMDDVVNGLGLGADDYLVKPFRPAELVARVRAKVERPSVPLDLLPVERSSGAATRSEVLSWLTREQARAVAAGVVANIRLAERQQIADAFGPRGISEVDRQVTAVIRGAAGAAAVVGRDGAGGWFLALPDTDASDAGATLADLARLINDAVFSAGSERVRPTPSIGYHPTAGPDPETVLARASLAAEAAEAHLDLLPAAYSAALEVEQRARSGARPSWLQRARAGLRTPYQILLTFAVGWVVPYFAYRIAGANGVDLAGAMYIVVIVALLLTGVLIWIEGLACASGRRAARPARCPVPARDGRHRRLPAQRGRDHRRDHRGVPAHRLPGDLQIILAYNTPDAAPVEDELARIARARPALRAATVDGQHLEGPERQRRARLVTGEFVGMFDADHHPRARRFTRAWRWLSNGVRRRPGPLRGAQRRRDPGRAAPSRSSSRPSTPSATPAARRCTASASSAAPTATGAPTCCADAHARLDADRGHRLLAAGASRPAAQIASDPALISRELAPTTVERALEPADALGTGLVPGLAAAHLARPALAEPDAAAEARLRPSCSAGARSTRGCRCRCSRSSSTGSDGRRARSTGWCRSSS